MADQNRVSPRSEVLALPARGLFMGNRGCLHREREIVRPFGVRRWITCTTEYKGRHLDQWVEGHYTVLFFLDEAVALAAGHRPCAKCQRTRFNEYRDRWADAYGERPSAEQIDARLHVERLDGPRQRTTERDWANLPVGAFAEMDDVPVVVLEDSVMPWINGAYGPPVMRPTSGQAITLTPPASLAVLTAGYRPVIAPVQG